MSVFLLQNNQHVYQILDDQEFALHYTAHSHQDDVRPQMKPYDEVDMHRNWGVEEGRLKGYMI